MTGRCVAGLSVRTELDPVYMGVGVCLLYMTALCNSNAPSFGPTLCVLTCKTTAAGEMCTKYRQPKGRAQHGSGSKPGLLPPLKLVFTILAICVVFDAPVDGNTFGRSENRDGLHLCRVGGIPGDQQQFAQSDTSVLAWCVSIADCQLVDHEDQRRSGCFSPGVPRTGLSSLFH